MMSNSSSADLVRMVTSLETSGRFRVLQRMVPAAHFGADVPKGAELRRAMVLDIRSTGLVPKRDRIYELGYVVLEYDRLSGRGCRVAGRYRGIEDDSGMATAADLAAAGLSSTDMQGALFDGQRIVRDIEQVDLVVSHNFGRDRRLLEARFPEFSKKWFACSQLDVSWEAFGIGCRDLEFMAMKLLKSYFTPGSAMSDAEALCQVLCHVSDEGETPLRRLLERLRAPRYRVWVPDVDAGMASLLQGAGYRVGALEGIPAMVKEVDQVEEEAGTLRELGLDGKQAISVDLVTGRERFTNRFAKREAWILAEVGAVRQ